MAFNKYMHPKNIYRTPPDFQDLAAKYPDFGKHVTINLNGEAILDFHNSQSLISLTKTLLKNDFNLNVNIPENHLIPTVPLRLNYILWIEDLLSLLPDLSNSFSGLDIGTGPCCIYPLLGCRNKHWRFLATDISEESLNLAQENINANGLQERIQLKKSLPDRFLDGFLDDAKFDFSMCNPPFFRDVETMRDRTDCRSPPRSLQVLTKGEKAMEGGELGFFQKYFEESLKYKNKIKIYTTMLGKKQSLVVAKKLLKQHPELSFIDTEFGQGRTIRWGLAWSFLPYINLKKAFKIHHHKVKKTPLTLTVPKVEPSQYTVDIVGVKIKTFLNEVKIEFEILHETSNSLDMCLKSKENTWTNQRRRRREQLRQEKEAATNTNTTNKRKIDDTEDTPPLKKRRLLDDDIDEETSGYILYCDLKLRRSDKELVIKMLSRDEYNPSTETMHQVYLYLKNKFH